MPRTVQTFDDAADLFDTSDLDQPWGDNELRDLWEAANPDLDLAVEIEAFDHRHHANRYEPSWDDMAIAA